MIMLTTEEIVNILRIARDELATDPTDYDFGDWRHCPIGHIYWAAEGVTGTTEEDVYSSSPESRFGQTIMATAFALGWNGLGRSNDGFSAGLMDRVQRAGLFVSDRTWDGRGRGGPTAREAAETLTETMRKLTAAHAARTN